jgi:MraZ protein
MIKFSGESESKLDPKGRLVLPTRFKKVLPDGMNQMVLVRGFEKCVVMYTQAEWEKIENKVMFRNEFMADNRIFQRGFLRGNTEVELDNLGRFNIPKTMAQYADLEGNVLIIGLGNRMEIWNSKLYDEFLESVNAQMSDLAERIMGDNNDTGANVHAAD